MRCVNALTCGIVLAIWLPGYVLGQVTSCPYANPVYQKLTAGCPTTKEFCSDILSGSSGNVYSTYTEKVRYRHPHQTTTLTYSSTFVYKTRTRKTIATTIPTTITRGATTTTVTGCNTIATCGDFKGPAHGELRDACSCVLMSTTTYATYSYVADRHTARTYLATNTITTSAVIHTTVHLRKTKHVPTVTAYHCSTAPPPAATCSNAGHQWAFYKLNQKDTHSAPFKWNLDYYKTRTPLKNGTATILGDILRSYDYYGPYTNDYAFSYCDGRYLNDRAYLYAPQTGFYQFRFPAYEQAAYLWVGDTAITGYNTSNADLSGTSAGDGLGGGPSTLIRLVQGKYYPIRIAWRCISSNFDFYMQIDSPDGHILHGEYSRDGPDEYRLSGYVDDDYYIVNIYSDYVVQFGCGADQKLAPQWPDWGSEP